jgi:fatty-acyl-CoA synthase
MLERTAGLYPEREVLVSGSHRYTFRQVQAMALRCAAGLYQNGLRQGDRLGLIMPNWAEFVVAFFAAARLGVVLVPLNVRYRANEVQYMLQNSEAKFVITCAEFGGFNFVELLKDLRPKLPDLQHVVVVGQPQGSPGLISWENLLHEGDPAQLPAITINPKEDLFTILYTSGTTGVPKGAMLTHANLVNNAMLLAEALLTTEQDRFLVAVPLFNIFGIGPSVISAYGSGACLVLLDIFKAEEALRLVQTERITVHHGVPTMFILELNFPDFPRFDLSSLRAGILAAAPAPVEIIRRIRQDMGCEIVSAYGMTETSPCLTITTFADDDMVRAETVGRALPGVEIKIVNDDGEEVPHGEMGELACRSSGVMKGYYKMPEATAAAIDNEGWFYTGDFATLDEQGQVRIVGRKKDMINRGGYKVYPREVEEFYYQHPKIQEVAVVGIPDPVLGERSVACIKLKPGQQADPQEMLDFLENKLADFKHPDLVRFVERFPMTSSGKIKKMQLRDEVVASYQPPNKQV